VRKSNRADIGASDEALLAGMAIGDEGAGVAFVRRYQRRVYGLAVGLVGDHALAEDIAQEALLRAWRHAPVFDPRRASVATWVLTITRNLAVDALRLRRAVPTDPEKLIEMGTFSEGASPEERAEASEVAERARLALASLPAEQRRAVVLASLYGYTAAEVSEMESIPLGTAKTRIRAGLGKLRDAATSRGLSDVSSDQ
jgi:RNA polymerase sigma factor (sigma-70 family)